MLNAANRYPTIVWDLGNVLIPWDRTRALLAATGDPDEARRLSAEVLTMDINDILDAGSDLEEVLDQVERTNPGASPVVRAYVEHFEHSLGPVDPDSAALVDELVSGGLRCVGLSNFSAITFVDMLRRYPVLGLLEGIMISGDVGVTKPNPEIFELCEHHFDLVPSEVVFIDDSRANTEAAAARGWDAITFTSPIELRSQLAARGLLGSGSEPHPDAGSAGGG